MISSVVPPLHLTLERLARRYFGQKPLFIEPGVRTGMPIRYDNPAEVGADRIVNAVAARERYGAPVVVVDFGTATTFDVVNAAGEYAGGIIAPGIMISAEALFAHASRLYRVDVRKPAELVGKNTAGAMQAGHLLRLHRPGRRHPGAAARRDARASRRSSPPAARPS